MLKNGEKLNELEALADVLADAIENAKTGEIAALAKQYRETLEDIEEIRKKDTTDDEIDEILSERETDGKPGAIRQDRSTV